MDLIPKSLNMLLNLQRLLKFLHSVFILIFGRQHAHRHRDTLCVFRIDHGGMARRDGGEGRAGLGC